MPKADTTTTTPPPPIISGKAALAALAAKSEAELIQLCAQHIANQRAFNADPLDDEDSPHFPPYIASLQDVSAARPMTLAGLAAKAQAAKAEARQPGGQEDYEGGPPLEWAWDLVNDLIRITAAPNPDAELFALCQEFIDLEEQRDEILKAEENGEFSDASDPIQARQEVLAQEIARTSFTTMNGARMIARAAACWAKDVIDDGFAELGSLHGDLYFVLVKGLIEGGAA